MIGNITRKNPEVMPSAADPANFPCDQSGYATNQAVEVRGAHLWKTRKGWGSRHCGSSKLGQPPYSIPSETGPLPHPICQRQFGLRQALPRAKIAAQS
jgi:hypothetical protein